MTSKEKVIDTAFHLMRAHVAHDSPFNDKALCDADAVNAIMNQCGRDSKFIFLQCLSTSYSIWKGMDGMYALIENVNEDGEDVKH